MTSDSKCEILGPFSLMIQGLLGLLAMSSLVWKRFWEYPNRRPWKIWFFDVSKQVLGALGVHVMNLAMSILGGRTDKWDVDENGVHKGSPASASDNPCDYYFLNILFDTTIGIPILWAALWLLYHGAKRLGVTGVDSGEYGTPPQYSAYGKQLLIYTLGLLCMKAVIYVVLIVFPFLVQFAMWVLSWSDEIPSVQLAFVLMIFPLIMNTFQYYVIDNIIQSPEYYKSNQILKRAEDAEGTSSVPESRADMINQYEDDTASIEGMLGQPKPRISEGEVLPPAERPQRPDIKRILTGRTSSSSPRSEASRDLPDIEAETPK